jgi:hypothetical protein
MATATVNSYDAGDLVRVSVVWTDADSAAVDPDVVRFKFRPPNGTLTTYLYLTDAELVKDSVGNYHVDVSVTNQPGTWNYRFEGETSGGVAQGADEHEFKAIKSSVL